MTKNRKTLFLTGIVLIALGVGYLSYSLVTNLARKREAERLKALAYQPKTTQESTTLPVTTEVLTTEPQTEAVTTTETKAPYVSPINFEELWAVNPDIYAWLEIVDTDVPQYPVLQHATDNSYYLNHTPEHDYGFPGSIFTYNVNAKDFSDFNTVIYGHRMNDGTMFSNLHDYRDEAFLKEHRIIKIYLPDRELDYTIFASVIYDDRLITDWFDFSDPEFCEAYLDSIYGNRDLNSHILTDPPVTVEDRIITLSTCVKGQESKRYLIVAVLTDEITE